MRKIMLIVVVVLLGIICYIIQRGSFLKFENKCIITNENGDIIPAKIYSRDVQTKVYGKEEKVYEILVFFDSKDMNLYNPVLFIPKYNVVGIVEGGKKEFISFGKIVFQLSDKSNEFTSLTNSLVFDGTPPVHEATFKDNEIIFNSFEDLKKYGKNIILKF